MARWIDGRIERADVVGWSRERIWEAIGSVEGLARVFPGLASMDPEDDRVIWRMKPQGAGSVTIEPRATTRIRFVETERIEIENLSRHPDNARVEGTLTLVDRDGGTEVASSLTLGVLLPIPWFVAPVAHSVMQHRLDRIAEKFLERLRERHGA